MKVAVYVRESGTRKYKLSYEVTARTDITGCEQNHNKNQPSRRALPSMNFAITSPLQS